MPEPKELEERYLRVYNMYHDIVCAKSGKPLFATNDAKAVHKSTLKHIRRNCVSDIPFVSYYSPIQVDRNGLMLYQFHQGMPGNEGLHQKVHQLVLGFSNSPRLMFAVLTDFFTIWNQNIDIRLQDLHKKYYGMYDGDIIEDEIERMTAGMNREVPPHPDWVSTRNVVDSNESFGFIDPVPLQAQNDDNSEDDESLVNLAEEAADELLELDMEVDESTDFFNNPMPPPSQWLASLHGRS